MGRQGRVLWTNDGIVTTSLGRDRRVQFWDPRQLKDPILLYSDTNSSVFMPLYDADLAGKGDSTIDVKTKTPKQLDQTGRYLRLLFCPKTSSIPLGM